MSKTSDLLKNLSSTGTIQAPNISNVKTGSTSKTSQLLESLKSPVTPSVKSVTENQQPTIYDNKPQTIYLETPEERAKASLTPAPKKTFLSSVKSNLQSFWNNISKVPTAEEMQKVKDIQAQAEINDPLNQWKKQREVKKSWNESIKDRPMETVQYTDPETGKITSKQLPKATLTADTRYTREETEQKLNELNIKSSKIEQDKKILDSLKVDETSKKSIDEYNNKIKLYNDEINQIKKESEHLTTQLKKGIIPDGPSPKDQIIAQYEYLNNKAMRSDIGLIKKANLFMDKSSYETERGLSNVAIGALQSTKSMVDGLQWISDATFSKITGEDIKSNNYLAKKMNNWSLAIEESAGITDYNRNFADSLMQGVGSAASFFLPGLGIMKGAGFFGKVSPKLASWFANSASTALEATAEAGSVFEEVYAKTGDRNKAGTAATKTFWANAILIFLTNKAGGVFENYSTNMIKKALIAAPSESLQEYGQQIVSNYSSDKPLTEGANESALIGGLLGFAMGLIGSPTVRERYSEEEKKVDNIISNVIDKTESIKNEKSKDFKSTKIGVAIDNTPGMRQEINDVINSVGPVEAHTILKEELGMDSKTASKVIENVTKQNAVENQKNIPETDIMSEAVKRADLAQEEDSKQETTKVSSQTEKLIKTMREEGSSELEIAQAIQKKYKLSIGKAVLEMSKYPKTEETTGNPEALDFTDMGTATGDVVAESAMIPLKNAKTVLKNAGYSDSAINEIITSLADKVRSSLGRQSIKASDIKEAAFEYSTQTKTPEAPTEQPKLKISAEEFVKAQGEIPASQIKNELGEYLNYDKNDVFIKKELPISKLKNKNTLEDYGGSETQDGSEIVELMKSIRKNGFNTRIVVDENGKVLDGNHRIVAMRELGIKNIPVYEKTKSQLEEIYKQAHEGEAKMKVKGETKKVTDQIDDHIKDKINNVVELAYNYKDKNSRPDFEAIGMAEDLAKKVKKTGPLSDEDRANFNEIVKRIKQEDYLPSNALDTLTTKEDNKEYGKTRSTKNGKEDNGEIQPNRTGVSRGSIWSETIDSVAKRYPTFDFRKNGNNVEHVSITIRRGEKESQVREVIEWLLPESQPEIIDRIIEINYKLEEPLVVHRTNLVDGRSGFTAAIRSLFEGKHNIYLKSDIISELTNKDIWHEGPGHKGFEYLGEEGRIIRAEEIKRQYELTPELFNNFIKQDAKAYWDMSVDFIKYYIKNANPGILDEVTAYEILNEVGLTDENGVVIIPENVMEASFNFEETSKKIDKALTDRKFKTTKKTQPHNLLMIDEINSYMAESPEVFKDSEIEGIAKFATDIVDGTYEFKKQERNLPIQFGGATFKLKDSTKLTSADIIKKHANIQLKRDIVITDVYGEKATLKAGEGITPYEVTGNKFILQDGEAYLVSKSQAQNVINNSKTGEAKPFAPELKQTEETIKANWKEKQADIFARKDKGIITKEQMNAELDALGNNQTPTKYSQYTLPGGENYKEILIKAPYKKNVESRWPNGDIKISDEPTFKSSHWDEPNVISHIRMNERTYNGKKVSFMEELQSDWAREARKDLPKRTIKEIGKRFAVLDENRNVISSFDTRVEAERLLNNGNVPTHPLLKNWQELSIKRALQEAVNSNAKYFAWINGPQTAARYNLSKQVDNIDWKPFNDGKMITINPIGGSAIEVFTDENGLIKDNIVGKNMPSEWKGKNIADAIGKGISEKIMQEKSGSLKGDGLNVGGSWASNLYDRQVRTIVENLTGQKVEMLDMGLAIDKRATKWRITKQKGFEMFADTDIILDESNIQVGDTVTNLGSRIEEIKDTDKYIITDILGNGKFKAVPKLDMEMGTKEQILRKTKTFDISEKTTQQMGIELTPEVKAIVKGEAPQVKVSGKLPFTEQITAPVMFKIKQPISIPVNEKLKDSTIKEIFNERRDQITPTTGEYQFKTKDEVLTFINKNKGKKFMSSVINAPFEVNELTKIHMYIKDRPQADYDRRTKLFGPGLEIAESKGILVGIDAITDKSKGITYYNIIGIDPSMPNTIIKVTLSEENKNGKAYFTVSEISGGAPVPATPSSGRRPGRLTTSESITESITPTENISQEPAKFKIKLPEEKSLISLHNISIPSLSFAQRLGGFLINPSMAVIDINKQGFDNYGEISLIGDTDLLSQGKTFASDIYSPRFPSLTIKIPQKGYDILDATFKKYEDIVDEKRYNLDMEEFDRTMSNSSLAMYDFLTKEGIDVPKTKQSGASHYDIKNGMRDIIQEKNLTSEFNNYIDRLKTNIGATSHIFKGYTYSGTRRYVPATVENISKDMRARGLADMEGMNYGLGSFRAKLVKKLPTIKKISEAKNRIVTTEEFEKTREEMNTRYSNLIEEYAKKLKPGTGSSNPFINFDEVSQGLSDYVTGKFPEFLNRFTSVPQSLKDKTQEFIKDVKEMPTEYFESKFTRPVRLSEFKYAVVPDNTTEDIIRNLENDGLQVITYKKGDETDRLNKIKELKQKETPLQSPVFFKIKLPEVNTGNKLEDAKQILANAEKKLGVESVEINTGDKKVDENVNLEAKEDLIEIKSGPRKVKVSGVGIELSPELQLANDQLEYEWEYLDQNPLKYFWKYANKKEGSLPELTGKKDGSIWGQMGDDLVNREEFMRFADADGYIDTERIRDEFYDYFKQKKDFYERQKIHKAEVKKYINSQKDSIAVQKIQEAQNKKIESDIQKMQKERNAILKKTEMLKKMEETQARIRQEKEIEQKRIANINRGFTTHVEEMKWWQRLITQPLNPLKYTDKKTQNIFQNWNKKILEGRQRANKEASEFIKIPVSEGPDVIWNYENGKQTKYSSEIKQKFDSLQAEARRRGVDMGFRENYIPHIYKEDAQEIKEKIEKYLLDKGLTKDQITAYENGTKLPEAITNVLKINPFFSKERVFPTYQVAMQYGITPKYSNPAQLIGYYIQEMETIIANNELVQELESEGKILPFEDAPLTWEMVNLPFSQKGYNAPKNIAKVINGLFTHQEPTGWTFISKISKKMQEIKLSAGLPYTTVNFFAIGAGLIKEVTAGNFKAINAFFRANFNSKSIKWMQENRKYMGMMAHQGINQRETLDSWENLYTSLKNIDGFMGKTGKVFDQAFGDKTFMAFMPMLQIQLFKDSYNKLIDKGYPQEIAEELAGRIVSSNFGLSDFSGRSKVTQDKLSAIFFAPQFREGVINSLTNTGKAGYDLVKNLGGLRSPLDPTLVQNRKLLIGMTITYLLYNLLNAYLNDDGDDENGKEWMWNNPKNRKFALQIPTDDGTLVYVEFMPSYLAFARNMFSGAIGLGTGDFKTAGQKFGSVFSMPIKTTTEILSNSDYFGNPIYKETDTGLQASAKIAKYLGLSVSHPYITEIVNQIYDKKPLYQSVIIGLELPLKFSSWDKVKQGEYYDALDAKAKENAQIKSKVQPTYDKVQELKDQGKTKEATALYDTLTEDQKIVFNKIKQNPYDVKQVKNDIYDEALKSLKTKSLGEVQKNIAKELYGDKATNDQKSTVNKEFAYYREYDGYKYKKEADEFKGLTNENKILFLKSLKKKISPEAYREFLAKGRKSVRLSSGKSSPLLISDEVLKKSR